MRRDNGLIQKIMRQIEADDAVGMSAKRLHDIIDRPHAGADSPHSETKIVYHLQLLMWKKHVEFMPKNGTYIYVLTSDGHDWIQGGMQ